MTAAERLEDFFGRMESVLDGRVGRFGPFLVVTRDYYRRQMFNAIDLGHAHARSEAGLPPVERVRPTTRPTISRAHAACQRLLERAPVITTRQKIRESAEQHLLLGAQCSERGVTLEHLQEAVVAPLRAVE